MHLIATSLTSILSLKDQTRIELHIVYSVSFRGNNSQQTVKYKFEFKFKPWPVIWLSILENVPKGIWRFWMGELFGRCSSTILAGQTGKHEHRAVWVGSSHCWQPHYCNTDSVLSLNLRATKVYKFCAVTRIVFLCVKWNFMDCVCHRPHCHTAVCSHSSTHCLAHSLALEMSQASFNYSSLSEYI